MDYRKLYHIMVDASERAIESIERGEALKAKEILVAAEQQAEDFYIDGEKEDAD